MLRFTVRSTIELVLTLVLGLAGLAMLLGTIDEYKAGRAFDSAMDYYAANDLEALHEALNKATEAKDNYTDPQEAIAKLLVDEGREHPEKYDQAARIFESLDETQEQRRGQPSLPVVVGLPVAELEAERAEQPGQASLAVAEARSRLEQARELYPESGDLLVNLATVALLQDDLAGCEAYLEEVYRVGNVSADALPYLYNVKGLLAFHTGRFQDAVENFENVTEFALKFTPEWEVARLNLGAAYAQSLIHGELPPAKAMSYARKIDAVVSELERTKSPLYVPVCHSLAVHYIREGNANAALRNFARAEKVAPLGWHARFNRTVARYLEAQVRPFGDPTRRPILRDVQERLAELLESPQAEEHRTAFTAACILGTVAAELGDAQAALAHFAEAVDRAEHLSGSFVEAALLRVHRSLAALRLAQGSYREGLARLQESARLKEQEALVKLLLERLRTPPRVTNFTAGFVRDLPMEALVKLFGTGKQETIAKERLNRTPYDLHLGAELAAPATPQPVTEDNVRLSLTNTLTGSALPVHWRLLQEGRELRGVALNLPQGVFRLQLHLVDALGNESEVHSREFRVDREPPRVLGRRPEPGASVKSLREVAFRVEDVVGRVDFATLTVTLDYPAGSEVSNSILVSRGKHEFSSPDGEVKEGAKVAGPVVRCPLDLEKSLPPGQYSVEVRVADAEGRKRESRWTFRIAP
ncbi:MAG: hypothetical protein ACOC8A_00305 [bacterium]